MRAWCVFFAVGVATPACGSSATGDGSGSGATTTSTTSMSTSTSTSASTVTSTTDSASAEDVDDGCDDFDVCCSNDIAFLFLDGRMTYQLELIHPGYEVPIVMRCPDGPHDLPDEMTALCESNRVRLVGLYDPPSEYVIRIDDGPELQLEDTTTFKGCDCNCIPKQGTIDIPDQGATSTDTGTSTGTATGTTGP